MISNAGFTAVRSKWFTGSKAVLMMWGQKFDQKVLKDRVRMKSFNSERKLIGAVFWWRFKSLVSLNNRPKGKIKTRVSYWEDYTWECWNAWQWGQDKSNWQRPDDRHGLYTVTARQGTRKVKLIEAGPKSHEGGKTKETGERKCESKDGCVPAVSWSPF